MNIAPNSGTYSGLVNALLVLQQFDEAVRRSQVEQFRTCSGGRKMDHPTSRNALYALAFVPGDSSEMAEQQQWFAGKPEENDGRSLASDTQAYVGYLGKRGN